MTEVDKGSMWTAFGHGLVGPKGRKIPYGMSFASQRPERETGWYSWPGYGFVATQLNLVRSGSSGKCCLCFLTDRLPWNRFSGERVDTAGKAFCSSRVFGALPLVLENPGKIIICTPEPYRKPHQVSKVSSLWSDRIRWMREVGKLIRTFGKRIGSEGRVSWHFDTILMHAFLRKLRSMEWVSSVWLLVALASFAYYGRNSELVWTRGIWLFN